MPDKSFKASAMFLVIMSLIVVAVGVYGRPTAHPQGLTYAPAMMVGEWTASDRPYKDVEKQIAQDYTAGRNMQLVLKQWQQSAASNPKDPVTQFAVVFASRGAYRVANPGGILPYSLVETLAEHDPGNVNEYARFRFCMTEEAERQMPVWNAEAIGKKLLQYDPNDNLVKINLIYMLCDSGHPQAALPYAQQWVKADPNNEKVYSSLALVYQDLWFATKNKAYGRLAVREFQQFLHFASPGDGFRHRAEHSIQVLQEEVARAG